MIAIRKALNFHAHSSTVHAFIYILSRVRSNFLAWKALGACNIDKEIRAIEVSIQTLEIYSFENPLIDLDNVQFNSLYNKHRALLR